MQADDDVPVQIAEEDDEQDSRLELMRLKKQMDKKRKPIDKQTAFLEYKQTEGKVFEDQIVYGRQDLKEKKINVKEFTEQCNATKKEMDKLK